MSEFLATSAAARSCVLFPDASNEPLGDHAAASFFHPVHKAPPTTAAARAAHAAAMRPGMRIVIGMPSPTWVCGLRSMLLSRGVATVTGSSTTIEDFLANCARQEAGIALADPALGDLPMPDFMAAVRSAAPKLRVVLMMNLRQPHAVREAFRAGASGVIDPAADAGEINAALLAVASGSRYIAPAIAVLLAESITLMDLTRRETEVLALLSQGECNKSIARGLGVTVGTAKTHVRSIMGKLDARSRTEAVHKAYRLGIVCLDR